MPTSQNNKLTNIIKTKEREIAELKEQLTQCQHDTEVKELKQQIKDLRAKNRKQNKYVEELEEENDEVYKQVLRVGDDKEKLVLRYEGIKNEYDNVANELAWKYALLEDLYTKHTKKNVHIPTKFIECGNERERIEDLLCVMRRFAVKSDPTEVRGFMCCLCDNPVQGFGNNPYPLKEEGKCCDECNTKVIMERFKMMREAQKE